MALKYLVYDDEGYVNHYCSDRTEALDKYYSALDDICKVAASRKYFSDYISISEGEELTDTSDWDIIESADVSRTYLKQAVSPWIKENLDVLKDNDVDRFVSRAEDSLKEWEIITILHILEELGVNVSKYL
jgi:hypothetical protein